jgi:hypothetical protein
MPRLYQFGLGGLGGLLPVLATLVAVDLSSIATLVDKGEITEGLCVGYAIRVIGLFALGGIMAALNTGVKEPFALVQIGIAAPALVTSYLAGSEVRQNQPSRPNVSFIISTAHAEPSTSKSNIILAGGFLSDMADGLKIGFGRQIVVPIGPRVDPLKLNVAFRVIRAETKFCLDVPPEQVKSIEQYTSLVKSFPPPTFVVEPGVCSK